MVKTNLTIWAMAVCLLAVSKNSVADTQGFPPKYINVEELPQSVQGDLSAGEQPRTGTGVKVTIRGPARVFERGGRYSFEIVIEKGRVKGVVTNLDVKFKCRSVILTSGTFLNGLMHVGKTKIEGGRAAEPPVTGLSKQRRIVCLRPQTNHLKKAGHLPGASTCRIFVFPICRQS